MDDNDLISAYNSNADIATNGGDEQTPFVSTPSVDIDAGRGEDFDLTKIIAAAKAKRDAEASAKDDDYGVLDRQRDSIIAETGEDIGKGEALARNLLPFVGGEYKSGRSAELVQLEKLRDGSAFEAVKARRAGGIIGDDQAGERKKRNMMMDAVNHSSFMGNSGFGAALEQIKHGKAQEAKPREETYFDQMENVAYNAGIDRKTIAKLRESSKTVDEFAGKLQGVAEGELKAYATRKKDAEKRLQDNQPGIWGSIANGLITNTGYQGNYLIGGGLTGGLGLAGVALQSAEQRALGLQTKEYDVDDKGNLIVIHNDDSEGKAMLKGVVGGVAEVAVEQALEKTLGLAYKGLKKIPGVGTVVGAVGDKIAKGASKIVGGIGAKLSKNSAGRFLVGAAENFGKYQKYTGVNSMPMEMLEEHVQDFADDVFGFNTKGKDYTTFKNETADWWHNKFWNAEHNKDLFLGLVGTMALQGAYAGTAAHHASQKWRQNPAGFLKTMLNEKDVDKLSDTEIRHLYNFVTSPRFTKENVERFLGRIQDHTNMANALMQLSEVNAPFFDSDQRTVDDAASSGTIKSQFVPPTTDVSGGKKVDWQPFMHGDGRQTQRIYDKNTGIAIDKLGENSMMVTNRDGGMRIVVGGETDGETFSRALAVADKMSISNQILDAKRPQKENYVRGRIAETAQNGRFVIAKNMADLLKTDPNLRGDPDWKASNPAVKLADGRVVLILDNMRSAYEVNRLILHEAAIHSGLNKMFTTEQKRKFLQNIKDPEIEDWKARVDASRAAKGLAPVDWNSDTYTEEAFAHVWDKRRTNPMLTQKVSHLMRDIGRALHLPVSYNRADIEVMVDTLQRDLRKQSDNAVEMSDFDTTDHAQSVPYNEAQRDFSGDVADVHSKLGATVGGIEARAMQRADRIKAGHPYLWQYAMRRFNNDEDAAVDYISERLEEEGKRGKAGEMDHAHHALLVAEKMEAKADLAPDDMEILDEHGFTGQVLYRDYGYRKQKNGSWRYVGVEQNAKPAAPVAKPTAPVAPKRKDGLTGAAAQKKDEAEAEKELREKFIESEAPRGIMAFLQENNHFMAKPERVRVVDPRTGRVSWRYKDQTAGDALDNFFDGMDAATRKKWSDRIFGKGATADKYLIGEHGDTSTDALRKWFNDDNLTIDNALDMLVKEHEAFEKFKARGGKTLQEVRDEDLNARGLNIGNEFSHGGFNWVVENYDDMKGEVIASVEEAADVEENPLYTDEERAQLLHRRFRVTDDGEKVPVETAKAESDNQSEVGKETDETADANESENENVEEAVADEGAGDDLPPPDIEDEADGLTLESPTADELKSEEQKRKQKQKIKERQEKSIKGDRVEQGQTLMDLGGAEGEDLFNRTERGEKPAPKSKPSKSAPKLKGADLGDAADEFDALAGQMWFSRDLEPGEGVESLGGDADTKAYAKEYARRLKLAEDYERVAKEAGVRLPIFGKVERFNNPTLTKLHNELTAAKPNALDYLAQKHGADWARSVEKSVEAKSREKQTILSGGTSLNQNPTGNVYAEKHGIFRKGTRNIDIGAGKYDKATQYLANLGVKNIPFDPVNRDSETNQRSAEEVRVNPADTATVHNVLNVIDSDAVVGGIINQAARGIKKSGTAIFTIYEGDRSGIGKATSRGYQRNAKASAYIPRIGEYFGKVEAHGNVIIAKEPKDVGTAFWAFDSSFDNGMRWFSRDLEPDAHTEEEKQAHNLLIGVKMVKLFASKGYKDFGLFAQTFASRAPEAYQAARNYLPGMWVSARMMGAAVDAATEEQMKSALEETDRAIAAPEEGSAASDEKAANDTPAPETTRGEQISGAADEIAALIEKSMESGEKFSRQTLEQIVGKHLGGSVAEGSFEMKDATDILELAVNRYIKNHGDLFNPAANATSKDALEVIGRIRKILDVIPTATTRSSKQEKMQQFSTPPHEAFMAAWVANIDPRDVSLEPSAGIGGIAVFSNIAGAKVILNELDADGRAKILEQLGIAPKVYNFNAENLWAQFYPLVGKGEVQRPTVVVMNPPFSNSQWTDRKDTVGIGGRHIEEALQMLAPNGRLVAIVGHGMAHDADSAKVRAWWNKIGSQYTVRADVTVNGQEYSKYGTSYDNDIIVIDKVKPDNTNVPIYGKIQSLDQLPGLLKGVRDDRPSINYPKAEPASDQQGGGGNPVSNENPAQPEQTGNSGTGGGKSGRGGTGSPKSRGTKHLHPAGNKRVGSANGSIGHRGESDIGNGGADNGGISGSGRNGRGDDGRNNQLPDTGAVGVSGSSDGRVLDYTKTDGETSEVREVGNGTFSEYRPSKVKIPGAKPHPTPLVESTAMASVQPPNPTYKPVLPSEAIKNGQPSEAQIEQIVYAGQAHEQMLPNGERKGYFIGDGTGVGKGTEISGIICDNFNHGRTKAVWVTKSSDLFTDAQRDLKTFGMENEVFRFDPAKKGTLARPRGIAFMSYDGLRTDVEFDREGNVLSSKKDKLNRFQHLVRWLGKDFDGVLVFDESHKAGNAVSTAGKRGMKKASKVGQAVVALQRALPKARVIYVSATGATEVHNLAYATRLGLWGEGTAFRDSDHFIRSVSAGGLSVMEIVARDMKAMGVYAARTLSYEGVVNRKIEHKLTESQMRKYDEFADAWQLVSQYVSDALASSGGISARNVASSVMSAFWGGQQRFFNQVLTAMQMPSIITDAKKQLAEGNSVVFQIVNTNEATQERAIRTMQANGQDVNPEELDLSPRDIIVGFVEHSFPTTKYVESTDSEGKTEWVVLTDNDGKPVDDPIALEAKEELLTKLRMMKLDENPLELLIDEFGADNVAEITGRTRRRQAVRNADGEVEIKLVRRSPKLRNLEIDEFNEGKRRVLVFSDAGGTGKSFHADKRFKNQSKRIHYLVQAGWRADGALQGFGRTHRSNEKQPPEYVLCSTDIRGHQRFISTVARRLAQLGSLTAGDRSSAGSGVFSEEDNLENQYAASAVKQLFMGLYNDDFGRFNVICKQLGFVKPRLNKQTGEIEEDNTLLDDHQLDVDKIPDVPTFLNRILNCRVSLQNQLFDTFASKMSNMIAAAKENGTYDPGLEKLQGDLVEEVNRTELWKSSNDIGSTDIVEVSVGKKTKKRPFDMIASQMDKVASGHNTYFVQNTKSGKVFGVIELSKTKTDERGVIHDRVKFINPDGSTNEYNKDMMHFDGEKRNYEVLAESVAKELWDKALSELPELNKTKRYFVHGALLPIWDRLGASNPRIYRIAQTNGGGSFLGLEISADHVNDVLRRFGKTPQSVELTPTDILYRVIRDGKNVPLLREGWELRRAKVNGDYRVELKGPESLSELRDVENAGVGTIEKIAYTPRLFIPRTEEGIAAFLAKYPAMPEDGGLDSVANATGMNYMAMSEAERATHFAENLNKYAQAIGGDNQSAINDTHDALTSVIAAMSTQELFKIHHDYSQYDKGSDTDPIHLMRRMVERECDSRGERNALLMTYFNSNGNGQWFSRDLEPDDSPSAISIYEVNTWRVARGLPEIVSKQKTTVDRIIREGKYLASNTDEIDRFIKVSKETPSGWTAAETNAVQQRRIELERDFDAKTELINEAEMNGNKEQAQKIREARKQVQDMIDTLDRANRFAAREWGLTGLARRFMLNRDGTFAKFTGDIRSDIGRQLTPEEEAGAKMLWDAYRDAQGKLDELTIRKTSELLKDILRKHLKREEDLHKIGNTKTLKEIEADYVAAIDHLIVHANRSGGYLLNLPDGRKWVDAIRRYHMATALEIGKRLSVEDMLSLVKRDLADAGIVADDHDVMQIITGHGNTYEADNSELEKAMREQRALMNEYQKWEDMMDEGHLPDKTGLIRDEPTQALREAQKITRDLMRDFMEKHPELMMQDVTRRLKTVQDSLMKRWKNEIEDLQKAIDNGEKIMRAKGVVQYTPEMVEMRKRLEEKRKEYHEMFPAEPLSHAQKLERYLKALNRRLAELEAKKTALEYAKSDEERAALLGKRKGEKFDEREVIDLKNKIAELKEDIQDLHDLHFPAGTYEEFRAMVERRKRALAKNIERIEAKLNARDFGPQKREPSALAKRVAADPEVVEVTRMRNAASKRLMQERERYKRSVLPYNAGRALDWIEALMAAPRVFRTMLDLSATMAQGAALFESHPVLGYQALVNSIKSFYSAENTDAIMSALMADPDYAEFIEMGGHVYNVSNLNEKGLPEEFRGIAQKLFTIKGKQYGLDDIPGVKASERSYGMFLNCMNVSLYKALKNNAGWGPTGPSVSQKKDIALSLNVASGRGYEDNGGRGTWDKVMSMALWAPRFAISGFKQAVGWNIIAPHFHGDITERSYKDRMVSSKQAAKEWARQMAGMAAWTLVATLLLGRKDPEWLEEVLNPLSSNFLNVRVGNTNLNFFGPIKQWWTFMARFITGKTIGMDGMVRNRDRGQTSMRFIRGKLSPLAGLVVDLTEGKDFLGDKFVWDRAAGNKEKSGWLHVGESLGIPLSAGDVYEAFKYNTLSDALILTPFVIAGAGKSTYELDEYSRSVSPYKKLASDFKDAQKNGRWSEVKQMRADNPILMHSSQIDNALKRVSLTKKQIGEIEKRGEKPSESLQKRYDLEQQQVVELIKKFK